jgi:hypothetical protein
VARRLAGTAKAARRPGRGGQVPRRCRFRSAAGLGAAAVIAALALTPAPSAAQIAPPNANTNLLQPSLDGSAANPPRFRRSSDVAATSDDQTPATDTFAAPPAIGTMPVYGSPSGFGAGDTGFDSTNTKGRRARARPAAAGASAANPDPTTTFAPLPTLTSPPPPAAAAKPARRPAEIHPAKAAARPGADLPSSPEPAPLSNPPAEVHPLNAANRPGAIVPIPPAEQFQASASTPDIGLPPPNTLPLGTLPQRPLPIAAGDPYEALGIKAGSFLILPAVELSAGYSTNPEAVPGGPPAPYFVVAPELHVQSDWSRHSLTADLRGSYTGYGGDNLVPSLNRPYLDAKIDGRIDVTRDTQIVLENRYIVSTDNPGSPNLQAGLAKLPINSTVGGTVGIVQDINRFSFALRGTIDRSTYQESVLTDGEVSTNDDRNFDQYGGILRLGYEIDPGLKPFVEINEDTRVHDLQFDRSDLQRDSNGTSAKLGAAIDLFGSLTGEMALGYVDRRYQDPTLPDVRGVIADGALLWQATALTTAKLTATSQVYESVVPGVSGELSRDLNLQVDHALRRWLIATGTFGFGRDEYVGSPRDDNRYFVSGGLTYKFNPEMALKGEIRQDWLTSTVSGVAYTASSFLLTLRLQR